MKPRHTTLTLAAAALLGIAVTASADNQHDRSYRDGTRHGHVASGHVDRKLRGDARGHRTFRPAGAYRDGYRRGLRDGRRKWASQTFRHLRHPAPWYGRGLRHGYRYRGDRYPRYGRYQSSAFSVFFDGIGIGFADDRYRD